MKFKKKDLIKWVEHRPTRGPRLRLHPRLRLRRWSRRRLSPGDLGIILETIEAKDAWEGYETCSKEEQEAIPNCCAIYFPKYKKKFIVYEDEIELCDAGHLTIS